LIKGRYIISHNGNIISESDNIITSEGMNIIRSYLAGFVPIWCGAIAIGSMNSTSPSNSDTSLDFQVARIPVSLISVEGNEIVVKGSLSAEFQAEIYELGIYPTVTNSTSSGYDDKLILNSGETWFNVSDGTVSDSSNFINGGRVGFRNIIFNDSVKNIYSDTNINLNGYSALDSIGLLYKTQSTGSNKIIRLTFYDNQLPTSGTKYYDFTLNGSSSGYKSLKTLLGNFTETGNFNGEVSRVGLSCSSTTGSGTFYFDSLKINDEDETNPNFALVSRSLVGVQNGTSSTDYVIKPAGIEVDIEYRMEVS
jgi:hypothetical protein